MGELSFVSSLLIADFSFPGGCFRSYFLLGFLCSCWAGIFMLKKCRFSTKSPFSAPFSEEIQQGQGEEAETPGGAGGDGCRLRQGGGSQQGERPPGLKNGAKKGKISPAASKPCPPFNFLGRYFLFPSSKTPSKPSRCSKNTTATGECPPPGMAKPWWCRRCWGGVNGAFFGPPPSLDVSIECRRGPRLEPATLEWAFELTKSNMQTL